MLRIALLFALSIVSLSPIVAQALDGVWRSEGYGYMFEIHGPELKAFEVTTRTCLPGFTARAEKSEAAGREATFQTSDGDAYFVKAGGARDRRIMHAGGSASDMRINRLPQRPAACDQPTPNTPLANFEMFTRTWAENYISFDLKHADWDDIVTERTTPAALFDILQGMIQPFGYAHTFISAPRVSASSIDFVPARIA